MQLETANYLIRGVSPFLLWMTTSISVGSAHTLCIMSPAAFQQQKWASAPQRENKTTHTLKLPSSWLRDPAMGQRKMERRKGGGCGESSVESPGAVSRSYTRSDRQQTQFTKRHLFHYSNALWLITSWPVCEMTATYSPVNRKICTCSIWGVEEPGSGGWGGRKGEREKTGENPRNTAFWQGRPVLVEGVWWATVFRLQVQRPQV